MATMGQHGDGTITARRDGRLQVAVTMLDRRREFAYVPKSLVRRDPKAAARMAERLRDELLERRDAELEPGRQTLAAYLRSWLTSLEQAKRRKVRPRTLEHYRLIVEAHIIPALGAVRLDRLREPAVQRWLDGMEGSPRSVMHRRAVLRRAYNVAQRKRLVVHNPAIAVELPEDDWAGGNPLSFEEARRLLHATADTRLGALWRLALDTGLREGELLGLGWTHLDPDARTVTLEAQLQRINRAWVRVPPKADRSLGRLAIMVETVDALEAHRRRQAAERRPEWTFWGLIFLTEAGEPYHRRAILREFHAACDAAGIERRRFHDLRASTAHLMSEAGVASGSGRRWDEQAPTARPVLRCRRRGDGLPPRRLRGGRRRHPPPAALPVRVHARRCPRDARRLAGSGYRLVVRRDPRLPAVPVRDRVQAASGHVKDSPNLIAVTRLRLRETGLPYVIENNWVNRRHLHDPVRLCGSAFGLDVQRHRAFESNVSLLPPPCDHSWQTPRFAHATNRTNLRRTVEVGVWRIPLPVQQAAMGIDWMDLGELSEAIPPAYTEWIGRQLIAAIEAKAA
jgi:integrase